MSKYSYGLTNKGKITGFYFDNQLNNPLLTITLHANTELATFEEKGDKVQTSLGRFQIEKKSDHSIYNEDWENVKDNEEAKDFNFDDGWVRWGSGTKGHCLSSILAKEWNSRHPEDRLEDGNTHLSSMAPPDKVTIGEDGIDWSGSYGYTPIATAILNEDFQINIQNRWTDVSGNNTLENFWNTIQPMAGFFQGMAPLLRKMSDNTSGETKFTAIGKGGLSAMSSFMAGASEFLNSSLVVQGSRFTIYQGTNTDFANLSMKFTLFSDWERVSDEPGEPQFKFMTVNQKLNRLWPYFQGYYQSLTPEYLKFIGAKFKLLKNQFVNTMNSNLKEKEASKNENQEEQKESTATTADKSWLDDAKDYADKVLGLVKEAAGDTAREVISKMIGFQDPPAGFKAINKNVDACQKGTFRLVFGGKYAIDNLVGGTMNVTLSKQVVKIPDTSSEDGLRFAPLSAEVVLNFKCASSFSNRIVSNILEGKGSFREGQGDEQQQYRQLFDILEELHKGSH